MNLGKKISISIVVVLFSAIITVLILNKTFPLDLARYQTLSKEVLDDQDQPLRIYLSDDGFLRLPISPAQVDERYIKMLVAYEDKRFYQHNGIDFLALGRATIQAITTGRVVSGASTLTMQVAKLLEPRERTLSSKIIEMFRAKQLEQQFTKDEILSIYLTLAPFGGNKEGVRAASLYYFGRPPEHMTAGEAALLVALPQSPSRNRPDRYKNNAKQVRDKILKRIKAKQIFEKDVIEIALKEQVIVSKNNLPILAPHLSDRLKIQNKTNTQSYQTWINADLQGWAETSAQKYVVNLPVGTSVALMVVDNKTRNVLSYVGSAKYNDEISNGYVDMVRATRSPGSTLKPMIFGMAFDKGIAHPESLINDIPTVFGNYKPKNFMGVHYGDVSITEALQQSLNVPAVIALERIGPVSFYEAMNRHGMELTLPSSSTKAGLAIALGGLGTNLEELVKTYAAMAGDGKIIDLKYNRSDGLEHLNEKATFIDEKSRWYLAKILRGVKSPEGLINENHASELRDVSYKTGTSYGFRDAWAIGYNEDFTVGVWIGRPDGVPNPGLYGATTAAPLLFKIFNFLPQSNGAHIDQVEEVLNLNNNELPPFLKRFDKNNSRTKWAQNSAPPQIIFPRSGAIIETSQINQKLVFEAEGGKRPYTWVINGTPIKSSRWSKTAQWQADGIGFSEVILIDALGRRVKSDIQVQ